MFEPVVINDITFQCNRVLQEILIHRSKARMLRYPYVEVTSISKDKTFDFICYGSNSEMGMWRLATSNGGGTFYKGDNDYVQ